MSAPQQHLHAAPELSLDDPLAEDEAADLDLPDSSGSLFRAGQAPAPGLYRQVDGPRTVELRPGEQLPASFDGRIALYRRVVDQWRQIEEHAA